MVKKTTTIADDMTEAELQEDIKAPFDFTSYQVSSNPKSTTVTISETGDTFDVKVKDLSWSRRNQILAESIKWNADGNTAFNSDEYVRACLKEILIEAPWGRTTETFLISIDSRLGTALEALVPKAFAQDDDDATPDKVKKE